jgi:hypothetical protein
MTFGVWLDVFSALQPTYIGASHLLVYTYEWRSDLLWLNVETLGVGGSVVGIVALNTLMLVWCLGMRLMITVTGSLVPLIILGRSLS